MSTPTGLGERGTALYQSLVPDASDASDAPRAALALEAARMADRLDDLDRVIQGDGILGLIMVEVETQADGSPVQVELRFPAVMGEARQLATALSGLLKTLGLEPAAAKAGTGPVKTTGSELLEKKRRERESRRAG